MSVSASSLDDKTKETNSLSIPHQKTTLVTHFYPPRKGRECVHMLSYKGSSPRCHSHSQYDRLPGLPVRQQHHHWRLVRLLLLGAAAAHLRGPASKALRPHHHVPLPELQPGARLAAVAPHSLPGHPLLARPSQTRARPPL